MDKGYDKYLYFVIFLLLFYRIKWCLQDHIKHLLNNMGVLCMVLWKNEIVGHAYWVNVQLHMLDMYPIPLLKCTTQVLHKFRIVNIA